MTFGEERSEWGKSALAVALLVCVSLSQSCVEGAKPAAGLPNREPPVAAYFQAMRAGQLATIGDYLAEDYFLIGVGGNTRDKAGRLDWLSSNLGQLSTIEPTDLKVRIYGDVAVVTGLVVITDETPTIYERFTHVWAYRSGRWLMVSGQVTAVAPEHQPKGDTHIR